jgi:hypothetical protein
MAAGITYSFFFNNIGSVAWSSTSPVSAPNSKRTFFCYRVAGYQSPVFAENWQPEEL